MTQDRKALLIKYSVCFSVASLITLAVFWIRGFFTDSISVNIQILSDGFSVSGILMLLFAGMLFISGQGGFVAIGFILRNVALAFIPMGRKKHEFYDKYRERKMSQLKKSKDVAVLVTGLVFLLIGIVFTVIWYVNFYKVAG